MATARSKSKLPRAVSPKKQLARYRSMRNFGITREPSGVVPSDAVPSDASSSLPFVIQKHAATRLHYDFRLGWNGVLKSWAVAKGPSYFPGDKRLAVEVEDHPLDYGGFEGIIPKGQYGGGTVMLWDRGTWEPHVDVDEGLRKGSLKFALHGEKLHGNWTLVRMGGRAANASKPNWLLIKEHDDQERTQDATPITEGSPDSVLSGRDIDAIARDGDKIWNSNRAETKTSAVALQPESKETLKTSPRKSKTAKNQSEKLAREISSAPSEKLPQFIAPQLASLARSVPSGDHWIHELKLDGYRIQARIDKRKENPIQLLTRTGLDWTHRMKPIADAVHELPVESAIFDGEVVVLSPNGTTSFANLQAAFQEDAKHELTYFIFDALHLDGHSLRKLSLVRRKKILQQVLSNVDSHGSIRLSEHLVGDAKSIFDRACELGAEGVVSKLADSSYNSGRSSAWIKLKCYQEQEFVIGGFTLPTNGIHGVGALLLGYFRDGKLIYAGRTGTGFTQKTHRSLRDLLEKHAVGRSPFQEMPQSTSRGVHWTEPVLVAQVSFTTWTADNLVRQAAFKGLREDKPAKSVTQEKPAVDPEKTSKDTSPSNQRTATITTRSHSAARTKDSASRADSQPLPIRLTHPQKVLDAESGVTKESLAHYYLAIADVMFPFIADRPLSLVRCLNGSGKPCFYQKHVNQTLPAGFGSIDIIDKKTGKPEPYITLSSPKPIIELAQLGVLEIHPWGSRNQTLETPDRIIFDLDPDAAISWKILAASAIEMRSRLKKMGLTSFVKSTGGKGLHVVVPIEPEHPWPVIKKFAHSFVLEMEKNEPSLFLTKMTKAARRGKIYLDYLRNERGATAVAPFSPRARAGLPVAMPLAWSELKSSEPPRFLVSGFSEWRIRLSRNPWKNQPDLQQHIKL